MAFNFSSSGGGGLFGSNSNNSNNTPSSSGTSSGGLFGSSTNKPSQPSLFGNPSTSTAGGAGGGGGGTFSFGNFGKPAATTGSEAQNTTATAGSTAATPSIFTGGFGTPDKSAAGNPATTSAPPLFGSTTPATTKAFSFGNSTTPAGPPPATSAFGTSTGGPTTNLFGSKPADDGAKPTPTFGGGFSFGDKAGQTPFKPAEQPKSSGFSFGGAAGQAPFKPAEPKAPSFNFGGGPGNSPFKPAESTSTTAPSVPATSGSEQKSAFSMPPASAPTTSQPAAAPQFGFGASSKPPEGQNLFAKPATTEASKSPFNFSQPATTQPSSGSSTPAMTASKSIFSGMGASAPASTATTASTAAPAPAAAANVFSFPPTTGAQPTTTSAAAPSPFSLPTTTTSQPTTTSAPAPSPFNFTKPTTTAPSQPASTAAAPGSTPFSALGTTTTTSGSQPATTAAAPGSTPFQASTTGPAPPAQSRLRNKTMDEILTRWATDMSRYSKEFKEHAETIARWDQLIVDNSSKIDKLYVRTRTAERQTVSVDMQLTAVENSQSELEAWLTKYENDVDEMLAKDSAAPSELGGPDQERERTYKLAEKLGERLDEMERDLGSMVEEVNAANASLSKNGKGDEPITQIVKILNSHLVQLQAIDQGTQALQEKVAAAQKAASQLGYLNGSSLNESNGAAVQDFYRSYMGRRT
ncbi:hypothetical protein G647_01999 [Cladophialophora carrionii CBS 160.54]|uniref:Nucleoporin NSP1-like C-terminal domain-containing protein n=1 Tax=Cladophialophora carrionii CBS 160.54 TaxID=1279043 RepID=V9DSB8_9EURO|nr:uncharacterized protein G647_01999 [Cladophialophora carrionii CBS 160.54]ETI29546.1 hypothetical protein G647_01999 [Cladophialophora carrionii CBS 160.54]